MLFLQYSSAWTWLFSLKIILRRKVYHINDNSLNINYKPPSSVSPSTGASVKGDPASSFFSSNCWISSSRSSSSAVKTWVIPTAFHTDLVAAPSSSSIPGWFWSGAWKFLTADKEVIEKGNYSRYLNNNVFAVLLTTQIENIFSSTFRLSEEKIR